MRKRFLSLIMIFATLLFALTSCGGNNAPNNNNKVVGEAVKSEAVIDNVDSIRWKAQVGNFTIYNIRNVTFEVALMFDGNPVYTIKAFNEPFNLDHNSGHIVEGSFAKSDLPEDLRFDGIRVVNLNYEKTSFMDTYRMYVIVMPIVTLVFAAIVVYTLSRGTVNPSFDTSRPSVVGLVAILILLTMVNALGWVVIGFLVGAAVVVFLSGYFTILIRKRNAKLLAEAHADIDNSGANVENSEVIDVEPVEPTQEAIEAEEIKEEASEAKDHSEAIDVEEENKNE